MVLVQLLAILHPDAIPFDAEELYNAAHARLIQGCHLDRWLDLQYRGYCGGCSLNAGLGAGFFALLGPSLSTWKLVPTTYMGIMAFFGARLLRTRIHPSAAYAWCLLLAFTPPTFLELSLTAWGNHYESGVAAIVTLYATLRYLDAPATKRAAVIGLSLSLALWIGMSSAFLVLGVGLAVARHIQVRHFLAMTAGLMPVGLMWLFQHLTAASPPFETIYYAGEQIPQLTRFPSKIWSLIAPRQLVALFGFADHSMGWVAGWTTAMAMGASVLYLRRNPTLQPVLLFLLAFMLVYGLVRFTVWTPPAPEIAPPGSMRYAAPLYGLLLLSLAAAAGSLWAQHKPLWTLVLLTPSLLTGGYARTQQLSTPFPDTLVFEMAAPDFEHARNQASYLIPHSEHLACEATDTQLQGFQDFSIAWHETRKMLDQNPLSLATQPSRTSPDAWEGLAAALLSEIDADEQGGIRTLMFLEQRLQKLGEQEKLAIHAEAAWRRNWDHDLPEHGDARLQQWNRRIHSLPASAQQGATIAFGRQWARDKARWRHPETRPFPDLTALNPALHRSFAVGFGTGIGERWGPKSDAITNVPTELQDDWEAGVRRGQAKRWLKQTR